MGAGRHAPPSCPVVFAGPGFDRTERRRIGGRRKPQEQGDGDEQRLPVGATAGWR